MGTAHNGRASRIGMTRAATLDLDPQLQGAATPGAHDEAPDGQLLTALIHIPTGLAHLEHAVKRIAHTIEDALAHSFWAQIADISNYTAAAFGAGVVAPAVLAGNGYTKASGVVLRNVYVGSSVAAVIQLAITRANTAGDLVSPTANPLRVVGTVRTVANALCQWFPGEIVLQQGESLVLYVPAGGAVNLDFSADYRILPQG